MELLEGLFNKSYSPCRLHGSCDLAWKFWKLVSYTNKGLSQSTGYRTICCLFLLAVRYSSERLLFPLNHLQKETCNTVPMEFWPQVCETPNRSPYKGLFHLLFSVFAFLVEIVCSKPFFLSISNLFSWTRISISKISPSLNSWRLLFVTRMQDRLLNRESKNLVTLYRAISYPSPCLPYYRLEYYHFTSAHPPLSLRHCSCRSLYKDS